MSIRDDNINTIREKDHENLRTLIYDSDTIINIAVNTLETKHREIKEKVLSLQDEKESLLRGPMSKKELLELTKECLKKHKADALSILGTHLSDCHKGHAEPFSELSIKRLFSEDRAHHLLWLFITEKEIMDIINGFDEIGISQKDKNARIIEIDTKILELMEEQKNISMILDGQS